MSRGAVIEPGERYGPLVVLAEPFQKGSHRYVRCRCSCGRERDVQTPRLRRLKAGCTCKYIFGDKQKPAPVEASSSTSRRSCRCGSPIIEAPLRSTGEGVLLEPGELFARGPCPRCEGRGTIGELICLTCRGQRIVGVSLTAGPLYALDAAGRVRAIAPAERRPGDALHRPHTCALDGGVAQHAAA